MQIKLRFNILNNNILRFCAFQQKFNLVFNAISVTKTILVMLPTFSNLNLLGKALYFETVQSI